MRISRKGALYFCGGIGSVGELKCGDGVITLAGEKFTVIAQNHEGYPENSTTIWSETSTGTSFTVYNKASSYTQIVNAAANMVFSDSLTAIELNSTIYSTTDYHEEKTTVCKQFALSYFECCDTNDTSGVWKYTNQRKIFTLDVYSDAANRNSVRVRYHNGVAVQHTCRDFRDWDDNEHSIPVITTAGKMDTTDGSTSTSKKVSGLYVFPAMNIPNTTKITGINSEGYYILAV